MNRLIITNGTVATDKFIKKADILAEDGRIRLIAPAGALKNKKAPRVINAEGLIVLPGIIDSHVHFNLDTGRFKTSDDFKSGSQAAACGGVTTVIDYTTQPPGTPLVKGIRGRMKQAQGRMSVDYSFHCVIPSWKSLKNPEDQIKEAIKSGIPSFKMFMIYEERGMRSGDADLFQALECSKKTGALICVHAESGDIINYLAAKYRAENTGAIGHSLSRPDFTEWEAVRRAITWAEITGGRLYFVHLSAGKSAELLYAAKKAGGNITGETCPQYLTLDDSVFKRKNGHFFATCPQVKKPNDSRKLWNALSSGAVSVIATDSCSFTKKQKNSWNRDFSKIPMGIPGTQTLLPLIYTRGVTQKKITLTRMVQTLCSNPAKIMGLYPQKGSLAPGSDADMAVINPRKAVLVDYKKLKHNCDWSAYQGMKLRGFPEYTILRGDVIAERGELTSRKFSGKFIKRKIAGK